MCVCVHSCVCVCVCVNQDMQELGLLLCVMFAAAVSDVMLLFLIILLCRVCQQRFASVFEYSISSAAFPFSFFLLFFVVVVVVGFFCVFVSDG